jgi:predicted small lipoprotein YifL
MKCGWISMLSIMALLAACGQTGPLYLPEEQPGEQASEPGQEKESDQQSDAVDAGEDESTDADESGVELRKKNQ